MKLCEKMALTLTVLFYVFIICMGFDIGWVYTIMAGSGWVCGAQAMNLLRK